MRKIYASPRLQNIEHLVAVMNEHGIATKVTNRRVYDRSSYVNFSYARPGNSEDWPTVWVVNANDHTRARQLMREIGIEPPTRYAEDLAAFRARGRGTRAPGQVAGRIRTAALAALVLAMAIYAARMAAVW
ncbi:MAG TPA: hypothetical protein VFJ87_11175 [Rhodanobacteraceae bacterium]|jgi:hypothetical protein|nr:hypothetical protein [Rhodanobacteraceae bacterium]